MKLIKVIDRNLNKFNKYVMSFNKIRKVWYKLYQQKKIPAY